MKPFAELTKRQLIFRIFWMLSLAVIISISIVTNEAQISSSEAQVICVNAYEKNAKYQAEIGAFSVSQLIENEDTWKIVLNGKLQNGFGAWQKVSASCIVYKISRDTQNEYSESNIKEFRYHL